MADTVYIVNSTLLGSAARPDGSHGHRAGEVFTPTEGVDTDRLLRLNAIREATADERDAFAQNGIPVAGAVLQGDAPDGQARVSSDTFAAVDPNAVTPAGADQTDATANADSTGKGKK